MTSFYDAHLYSFKRVLLQALIKSLSFEEFILIRMELLLNFNLKCIFIDMLITNTRDCT